jgi:hypothetical protein
LVNLDIVFSRREIDARFAPNVAWARKSFWAHPMVLLGDVGQEEAPFSLFGDSVNINAREVHGLRRTYYRLRNHFGCNRLYSYVTCVKWKLVSVHLEIVLISTQDRWMVCAEYTLAS